MRLLLGTLCLVALGFGERQGGKTKLKPPGLRVDLTRSGLDYGATVGRQMLNHMLPSTVFPPVSFKVTQGPGFGQASLHNVTVSDFDAPSFTYDLQPDSSILWMSSGGRVTVEGLWEAWYKVLIRAGLKGSVTAEARDLSLEIVSDLSLPTPGGLPLVNVSHCSADIGHLDINIQGGTIQWFINIFRHHIANKLKTLIQDQVCIAASGMLQNLANGQIQSLPTLIPLYGPFTLHYGMTSPPIIEEHFVRTLMQAEISWQGKPSPVRPPPLPPVSISASSPRHLYLTGSDFVLNSFLASAQAHKALQFVLRPAMLPGKMRGFLRTSCERMCIGRLIPAIGRKFPNDSLDLHLRTSSTPRAVVGPDGARLTASVLADVYGFPMGANAVDPGRVFALRLDVAADLEPFVHHGAVAANFSITDFRLAKTFSAIGPIPRQSLSLIGQLLRTALEDFANVQLRRGVRIPTVEGVSLKDPEIRLLDRALAIETDIQYLNFDPALLLQRMRDARNPQ